MSSDKNVLKPSGAENVSPKTKTSKSNNLVRVPKSLPKKKSTISMMKETRSDFSVVSEITESVGRPHAIIPHDCVGEWTSSRGMTEYEEDGRGSC